jgi:hypothetical protein
MNRDPEGLKARNIIFVKMIAYVRRGAPLESGTPPTPYIAV